MTSCTIVDALPEHIDRLCAIGAECGLSTWTAKGYESEMEREDSVILVAQDASGDVLGFIVGRSAFHPESPAGGSAEIYNIGNRPFIRKTGVGSMLLNRFLEVCGSRGADQVWLEVRASNHEAKSFYSSRGFRKCAVRRDFYTAPADDAEVMRLDIDRWRSELNCKDA